MTPTPARRGRRSKAEAEATREALIAAGRELYATVGYDEALIEQIAERAGVTKGAFYHHFRDRADLLDTIYREVEIDFDVRALRKLRDVENPFDGLRIASDVYLDECLDPLFRNLVLVVPATLGWRRFRGIDVDLQVGGIEALLRRSVAEGLLAPVDTTMLSHLLMGSLQEAAFVIADAKNPKRARKAVGATYHALLDALLL